jgi:hypothetical protein
MFMIRWKDGRAAEAWNEFDEAGLMRQIMPQPQAIAGGGGAAPAVVKIRA